MSDEAIRQLVTELAQIAQARQMRLKICSQKAFLVPGIVEEARCVDADRLERIAGRAFKEKKQQKGNRKECGCYASKDLGEYDTCPHGCVYCYAVQNRDLAVQRYKAHNPQSPFLFHLEDDASLRDIEEVPQIIPLSEVNKKISVQEKLF
jgi:hypothetical protein